MDLDQLRTFLEIVRLKSFSKAAQAVFRTQPAISAQVRQLEQELNTSLFERLGTRIALTAAGKVFAEYAEQILELRKRAQTSIQELESAPRGELSVAANEATCIYVLPGVFAEYRKLFPNVQLHVERSYSGRIVDSVVDSSADFGITQLPVGDKRLQVARIHSDEIVVLVPATHAIAKSKSAMAKEVAQYPLILPKVGTTRARLNEWLELEEDNIRISMELDGTEMVKRFVRAGLGISFIARSHCREEIDSGALAGISLAPEPMIRQLGLIYRKDKALSKAALAFIQLVLDQMVQPALPKAAGLGD